MEIQYIIYMNYTGKTQIKQKLPGRQKKNVKKHVKVYNIFPQFVKFIEQHKTLNQFFVEDWQEETATTINLSQWWRNCYFLEPLKMWKLYESLRLFSEWTVTAGNGLIKLVEVHKSEGEVLNCRLKSFNIDLKK